MGTVTARRSGSAPPRRDGRPPGARDAGGRAPGSAAAIVRTLGSLDAQTSDRWSLTVLSGGVTPGGCAPRSSDRRRPAKPGARIHVVDGRRRGRMTCRAVELLRRGLDTQDGDGVALVFPGDVWAGDAVAQLSAALTTGMSSTRTRTRWGADGVHRAPRLKPDFSPDFLLSSAYVGRPVAIGTDPGARPPSFGRVRTGGTRARMRSCMPPGRRLR